MSEELGASIVVENLTKEYGDFRALDNISFEVQPGQIVGFLGPNGAGKTTTMKILTCFMAATKGSALVAGYDVYAESEQVRKRIGYLPENVPLYDEMLVYDYLVFIAEVRGISAAKRHEAVKRVIEQTGLADMVKRDIHELSKGYRQRVGLAQAIIHQPDVVILDEPTSGLDPNQILEIRDLIKEIGREKTVIFSTHILQEVAAVCDRIIVINRGKIVADGTFDELALRVAEGQHSVTLSFTDALDRSDELEKLSGVLKVVQTPQGEVRLISEDAQRVHSAVVSWAHEGSIKLRSVSIYQPDLEEVFRSLTADQADTHVADEEE